VAIGWIRRDSLVNPSPNMRDLTEAVSIRTRNIESTNVSSAAAPIRLRAAGAPWIQPLEWQAISMRALSPEYACAD